MTAAVGIKCPECAQQSRTARAAVPRTRLAAGMVAALAVALVGGTLLAVVRIPFLGIILAYALGALVGATARRASGGFRDDALTRVATIAAAVGVLALPGTWIVQTLARGGSVDAVSVAFVLIAAVAAAFGAVRGSQ